METRNIGGRLVAVLHSRPTGRGSITRARVEGISVELGCDSFEIVNLYAAELPTSRSLDTEPLSLAWAEGRREIEQAVRKADTKAVLLGYGVGSPAGLSARVTASNSAGSPNCWSQAGTHPGPTGTVRLIRRDGNGSLIAIGRGTPSTIWLRRSSGSTRRGAPLEVGKVVIQSPG